ncbi:MAG TPA: hypothetical protein VJ485_01935 [archaeon]|jgi:DNA-directed RNA polymerase subunit RPC12/RpoP|nr:hypothetical protein [archaeon]
MARIKESDFRHLPSIVCPFCDHRVRSRELTKKAADEPPSVQIVKCWNCGEAFEADSEYEYL